jgi:hypothetical protein
MGKESAAGPEIKKVFWDGDEKGRRFPVAWKRTWVRGSGDALGFDVAVRVRPDDTCSLTALLTLL